jgi:mannose-6-phosphate isomerase-like protein (cupin superfamily)
MPFDLDQTYIHLGADGLSAAIPGGEQFWSLPAAQLEHYGQGWLVSQFECQADWPAWEMHPNGDEFVYLLAGRVTLIFDIDGARKFIELNDREATVIPRGVWHTAKVLAPSRMMFITRGAGTEHRNA